MTVDHDHELAAAYALGALADGDRNAYEAHLSSCETCRDEVDALSEAAGSLALAVDLATPPPGLRDRLLQSVREEQPLAPVVPLRRVALPLAGSLAAVAACAAIALGLWAVSLRGSLTDERQARGDDSRAAAVLADPAARRIPLSGATGVLVVGRDGTAALAVSRLARVAKGRTYEAWVIRSERPEPAGTFSGRGERPTVVVLSRRVPAGAKVAVTVERAGGVEQPTSEPILRAST